MRNKSLMSPCDAYMKGGYWGLMLGITTSGASSNWNGNRVAWVISSLLVLCMYLFQLYRVHKSEQKGTKDD